MSRSPALLWILLPLTLFCITCSDDDGFGPSTEPQLASCVEYETYLRLDGFVDTPGRASGVAISGTTAFIADHDAGLQVIDVSNPSSATIVGAIDTPGSANACTAIGNTVYVADGIAGLQIIDASDPSTPVIVGTVDLPGEAFGVSVQGSIAYVPARSEGLQIVDVSNPSAPAILGSADTPGDARNVAFVGDVAFVADGREGLQLIDISNPAAPELFGNYRDEDKAVNAVAAGGQLVYIIMRSELGVLKVSPNSAVSRVGKVTLPGTAFNLALEATKAYIADIDGMVIIDIAAPTAPRVVGGAYAAFPVGIAAEGQRVYTASDTHGLFVIDVSSPQPPEPLGNSDLPGVATSVALHRTASDEFVLGGSNEGFYVYHSDWHGIPRLVGSVTWNNSDGGNLIRGIASAGSYAYVVSEQELSVVDLKNATMPRIVGTVPMPAPAWRLDVGGGFAFVAGGSPGLQVVSIANPAAPEIVGTAATPGYLRDVVFAGSLALGADEDGGLQVFVIGNPTSPSIVGMGATTGDAFGITVAGTFAYLATSNGLEIFDVSDPTVPVQRGAVRTPDAAFAVSVSGRHAYVASAGAGIQVIDVTNPASPQIVGSYSSPCSRYLYVSDVIATSDRIWFPATCGLMSLPLQCQ